jgi:hypothetical protein
MSRPRRSSSAIGPIVGHRKSLTDGEESKATTAGKIAFRTRVRSLLSRAEAPILKTIEGRPLTSSSPFIRGSCKLDSVLDGIARSIAPSTWSRCCASTTQRSRQMTRWPAPLDLTVSSPGPPMLLSSSTSNVLSALCGRTPSVMRLRITGPSARKHRRAIGPPAGAPSCVPRGIGTWY